MAIPFYSKNRCILSAFTVHWHIGGKQCKQREIWGCHCANLVNRYRRFGGSSCLHLPVHILRLFIPSTSSSARWCHPLEFIRPECCISYSPSRKMTKISPLLLPSKSLPVYHDSPIRHCIIPIPKTFFFLSFLGWGWDWVHLVRRSLFGLLYQPRVIDEYGTFRGTRISRGNRSTVKPRFTNLIRSWRSFVNRNYFPHRN
jgi:hypothetical protein